MLLILAITVLTHGLIGVINFSLYSLLVKYFKFPNDFDEEMFMTPFINILTLLFLIANLICGIIGKIYKL